MAGSMADDGVVDGGGRRRERQRGPKRGDETTGGGPAGRGLPVHCASAAGGEGPYGPAAASTAIHDHRVLRAAGTHHRDGIDGSMARRARRLDGSMGSTA
jgi:hypothetical protein